MRWLLVALVLQASLLTAAARAQCGDGETLRFQHYDGTGFDGNVTPLYPGEQLGIVVDGLPAEHFPITITRVGFGLSYSSPVDVLVYDTWPLPGIDPQATYVHPGVTTQLGINTVDVTPSGPMTLTAQPFTVTILGRGLGLSGASDGTGCVGGPGSGCTSVYHFLYLEPGQYSPRWSCPCFHSFGDLIFWIEYRPAAIGTPVCLGDGSAGDCPCGSGQSGVSGAGCAHSSGGSGVLNAWGKAQVSDDTLTLVASGLPPSTPSVFFQYSALATAIPFGDGLLCAGGPVVRLAGMLTPGGVACLDQSWLPISVLGGIPLGGGNRHYQVWYRDFNLTWCTTDSFNLSNGLQVAWLP